MAVKQIRLLEGDGWLRLGSDPPASVRYSIGVWSTPDGVVFGKGYISDSSESMFRAFSIAPEEIPLQVADGDTLLVVVTARTAGKDWAEIGVSRPLPTPFSLT